MFYQYQFFKAENVVADMIQTEQPYYQPTPKPPEPFKDAVGSFNGDQTFPCTDKEPCDEGWAVRVVDSQDITILGAGLYSWFDTYEQECGTSQLLSLFTSPSLDYGRDGGLTHLFDQVPKYNCQKVMVEFKENHGGVLVQNLVTIGATNVMSTDGTLIPAEDNVAVHQHPFWSHIASYVPKSISLEDPSAEPVEAEPDDDLDSLTAGINAHLNEDCYRFNDCVDLDNPQASGCKSGYSRVGYDRRRLWRLCEI